ncbi:hypothetical protein PVL29_000378 [Vitis rotundifolia]|uniref:C3H1-type domain-containing protein n=1 Tax=Vitis rotundifolia TaxID=103349 RepID=A0AA39AIK3_VITRO|nr:hypothetical protein PVL29_000378 [Vitis rotundifolia]
MQKDISISPGGIKFFSSSASNRSDGLGFPSLYSSIFSPKPSLSNSVSLTPSEYSTDEDVNNNSNNNSTPTSIDNVQALEVPYSPPSRLIYEHQDLINRHNLCLTHLRETAQEAEVLRHENSNLRIANRDLNKRLSLLIQNSIQNRFVNSEYSSSRSMADEFRRLGLGDGNETRSWDDEISNESPTSVIESDRVERIDVERITLPKSISVRSNGYLKMSQPGTSEGGRTRIPNRLRTTSPLNGTQKVYVRGVKKEEEPVELEVYNQGMFKTELCNKWQESGTCPYGDHCQFAHGIEELRPVIRHPRYKTEVCRMVLAGDACPYGHRCHFRHALTEQERFMGQLQPRAIKLDR